MRGAEGCTSTGDVPWATSARSQRSEAPRGAGLAGCASAAAAAPRHRRSRPRPPQLQAQGCPVLPTKPFLPCPGPRVSMPPGLLPASSQGRATAVACVKVRFPQAALAAGCAPPRPRRILRSPCRPAAISDRRRRNLPKMGRKGPNLRLPARGEHRGVRDFPDASEGTGGGGGGLCPLGSQAQAGRQ